MRLNAIYESLPILKRLIGYFSSLPGIGEKTAVRMALSLLDKDNSFLEGFSSAILTVKDNVRHCKECGLLTEGEYCYICLHKEERENKICVVKDTKGAISIEKTSAYKGLYHVLGGYIAPIDGISPSDLNIHSLLRRVRELKPDEVILALEPTAEGELTEMYIRNMLKDEKVNITRLAYGIPTGGYIEYLDAKTIYYAIKGRVRVEDDRHNNRKA
jgi:recombination protein RecR